MGFNECMYCLGEGMVSITECEKCDGVGIVGGERELQRLEEMWEEKEDIYFLIRGGDVGVFEKCSETIGCK